MVHLSSWQVRSPAAPAVVALASRKPCISSAGIKKKITKQKSYQGKIASQGPKDARELGSRVTGPTVSHRGMVVQKPGRTPWPSPDGAWWRSVAGIVTCGTSLGSPFLSSCLVLWHELHSSFSRPDAGGCPGDGLSALGLCLVWAWEVAGIPVVSCLLL